jgi:hypothetical protein
MVITMRKTLFRTALAAALMIGGTSGARAQTGAWYEALDPIGSGVRELWRRLQEKSAAGTGCRLPQGAVRVYSRGLDERTSAIAGDDRVVFNNLIEENVARLPGVRLSASASWARCSRSPRNPAALSTSRASCASAWRAWTFRSSPP